MKHLKTSRGKAQIIWRMSVCKKASTELREAIMDLSRRPEPDLSGALVHAFASLECTLRHLCNGDKRRFKVVVAELTRNGFIPSPLNDALVKLWGYASEYARHGDENKIILSYGEVELAVHTVAAVANYLSRKVHQDANS